MGKLQRFIDIVCSMTFMGSLWQLEIADLCIYNGWEFGYLFCAIVTNNLWGVRDFFMLLMCLSLIGIGLND